MGREGEGGEREEKPVGGEREEKPVGMKCLRKNNQVEEEGRREMNREEREGGREGEKKENETITFAST